METFDKDLPAGSSVRVVKVKGVVETVVGVLDQDASIGDRFIYVKPVDGSETRRFLVEQCSSIYQL